jgi:membrane-bound serine protease (ClpP class)
MWKVKSKKTVMGWGRVRVVGGVVAGLVLFLSSLTAAADQGEGAIHVLTVDGVIDPIIANYVSWGLQRARDEGAQAVIIELNTPGGLDSAMRSIVQEIMGSPVPVVVYVTPAGARAGSAGVFITLAAHVAAMAPGTNIGAATPVAIGGGDIPESSRSKLVNDAAAYIRAIAEERGRDADWAEEAVREGVSITAQVALNRGVIDHIAPALPDLLRYLDGQTVTTASGERTVTTAAVPLVHTQMNLAEKLLHFMVDPSIAYLLLTIGLWALVAEFYNPGAVLPGVTGVLCLILAFIALGSLPVNWGGVLLIGLAVALFILDIKVAGFALSVGGAIAFVLGSLLLFRPFNPTPLSMPSLSVNPWLVALMTAGFVGFFLLVVSAGWRAQRAAVITGPEVLIGQEGRAITDLAPEGTVLVRSEDWSAEAVNGVIEAGEQVTVVGVDGVRLRVTRCERRE